MRAVRRAAVLVLLGLILGAPWATAAEARAHTSPQDSESAARAAFDLLASWGRLFQSVWRKEGCTMDPLGGCSPGGGAQAPPAAKEGCTADPLGGCGPGR